MQEEQSSSMHTLAPTILECKVKFIQIWIFVESVWNNMYQYKIDLFSCDNQVSQWYTSVLYVWYETYDFEWKFWNKSFTIKIWFEHLEFLKVLIECMNVKIIAREIGCLRIEILKFI